MVLWAITSSRPLACSNIRRGQKQSPDVKEGSAGERAHITPGGKGGSIQKRQWSLGAELERTRDIEKKRGLERKKMEPPTDTMRSFWTRACTVKGRNERRQRRRRRSSSDGGRSGERGERDVEAGNPGDIIVNDENIKLKKKGQIKGKKEEKEEGKGGKEERRERGGEKEGGEKEEEGKEGRKEEREEK